MSSILAINASRANGAKSRGAITVEGKLASAANSAQSTGPVSSEGKARCAQNALRHGMLAQSVVIPTECEAGFIELLSDLQEELRPVGHIETRLVENMAVADWRRMRLWCFEMAQYTHAIHIQERAGDPIANEENNHIPSMHAALAFGSLCDRSRAHELLNRYEVRFSREYRRTHADFRQIRAERLREETNPNRRESVVRQDAEDSKSEISKQSEPGVGGECPT